MSEKFWYSIYSIIFMPIFRAIVFLASFFNSKIKKGVKGREKLFEELILSLTKLDRSKKMIWFHSSSLGEFEQAKPIIEHLKSSKDVNILVTFFSPSGYDNSKKYPYADVVTYLPIDTAESTKKFITIANPDLALFMRYDIWPNMIRQLKKKGTPIFIVDATMRKDTARKIFPFRSFHKILYDGIARILTVSAEDAENFKVFGVTEKQLSVVGDTKYDRVHQNSVNARKKHLINDAVFENKKVMVAGSSWEQDEEVLLPSLIKLKKYDPDLILIIAPHEPTVIHLENLENELAGKLSTIRFSSMNNYKGEDVILIDSIGILLTLYYYADLAYIGGGFKQNIHNCLEAAVYGIPVIMGPKIENSQEAIKLTKAGGGVVVHNKKELYRVMRTLVSSNEKRKAQGKISADYIQKNLGATDKILKEIRKYI